MQTVGSVRVVRLNGPAHAASDSSIDKNPQHAKARQHNPAWQQDYRAYRPVVERKISHFTRRPWGGRKARCRGHHRILTDVLARAGAINLARLATLGLHHGPTGWAIA